MRNHGTVSKLAAILHLGEMIIGQRQIKKFSLLSVTYVYVMTQFKTGYVGRKNELVRYTY